MKIIFILLLGFGTLAFTQVHAQLFVPHAADSNESSFKSTTGKVMAELLHALKTDTYLKTAGKDKTALLAKTSGISTASDAGAALVSLSKIIKPNKFKSSFKAADFVKRVTTITTLKQADELLIILESGLAPDAFISIWKLQRINWLKEVNI